MQKIKVVKVTNLNNLKLEQIENRSNTLFITSTRSLNYQSNKDKSLNVIDFTQLHAFVKTLTKAKDSLLDSEMRYLLYKTISNLKDNHLYKLAYLNSVSEIYELFSNLLISNISESNINIKDMKKTQLQSKANIFELYLEYLKVINEQGKATYQTTFKECLKEYLSKYDQVCLIGFTFFNDIQNAMFEILNNENKLANIITDSDFVIDDFIKPLLKHNKLSSDVIKLDNAKDCKFDELRETLFTSKRPKELLEDDIVFYKPFYTREMEFNFIISQIVSRLKPCATKEEIEKECEKIAVVITNQFAKQTQVFNELLKRQGVFIAPNNQTFYSQDEFLNSDYESNLQKELRLAKFDEFTKLEMYQPPKTLFNSVLGRFVCEIYKISGNGLKLSNFHTLLQINWLFKETQIDDIISQFNSIRDFFENLQEIAEWKQQIEKLINLKETLEFDKELHNHPLKAIRIESLEFIRKYINFLDKTTNTLKNISGSVKKHIKTLIEAIKSETDDEVIEKQLLDEFEDILNAKDDSVDIDNDYFAKNFQLLVNEYLSSKKENTNNIRINAINLESANSYDVVFVPMFENDKYPMAFKYEFPYDKSIVNILQNSKLISNYQLPLNKTLEYNVKLSKYVFENLFRIAKDKVIFTRIGSEKGTPMDMSIFGYDIQSKCEYLTEIDNSVEQVSKQDFDEDLIFKETTLNDMYLNEILSYFVCPKMFYYMTQYESENCFKDKFLLNFYAKALVVNKTLSTLANGRLYDSSTLKQAINNIIDKVADQVFEWLPLFDDNNKNDIKLSASTQLYSFINDKILTGRYKPKKDFTLTLSDERIIKQCGIQVKTYKNLVVTDIIKGESHEFDISKSLDCLTSSSGGKQTELTHFWEIIDEMENVEYIDRANSLNFLSFKLNTQLNTPKYNRDGIQRAKELISYVDGKHCSTLNYIKSPFCTYCKYKNICLGGLDNE